MIHIVLGTRAQLVKMAPVMARLRDRGEPYRLIHTGQHHASMDEMLVEFELKRPDVVLYSGPDVVSLPQMAFWGVRILFRCLTGRRVIFGDHRRGIVLVHGDTVSTLLGALMGRVAGLTVGHVESGLRSFRLFHPFPEEITRLLTFRLSHVLFCPGEWAMGNVAKLRREKINTGSNTLGDTLALAIATGRSREHVPSGPYGLVSLHRYENIFSRQSFEALITLVEEIATAREDGPLLLFILHPPTARQLERFGLEERLRRNPKIELRPRYTYFDFVTLIEGADFVVTDGGSIQEESSYLGIPCLLMREATERQEGLGANVLLSELAPERIREFGRDPSRWRRPRHLPGNRPSDRIADAAVHFADCAPRRDQAQ